MNRLLQIIERKQKGLSVTEEESSDIKGLINTLIKEFPGEFDESWAQFMTSPAVEKAVATERQNSDKLKEELAKLESQRNAAAKQAEEAEFIKQKELIRLRESLSSARQRESIDRERDYERERMLYERDRMLYGYDGKKYLK